MAEISLCDAFRSQLILPEQRDLFDYWQSQTQSDGSVSRSSINPADIPRLLPNISLIEVSQQPLAFRCRLAGTKLRDIYDRDITGLELSEIYKKENYRFWQRTYARLLETGMPSQGIVRGSQSSKQHLVQFWLRMPLKVENRQTGMILCHDSCLSVGDSSELLHLQQDFQDTASTH